MLKNKKPHFSTSDSFCLIASHISDIIAVRIERYIFKCTNRLCWKLKIELWSTRALKPGSLDADPWCGFNVVSRELHRACRLCACMPIALLDRSTVARISDPDRGHVEAKWSLNTDPQSTSDPDPRFCVESPVDMLLISLDHRHLRNVTNFEVITFNINRS